jgi:uncharacterized membrane-anchored protein YitT (DUF2179 family)
MAHGLHGLDRNTTKIMAKKHLTDKIDWKSILDLKNLFQIIVGTGLAVLAMKGFMIPNRFLDGGVTSISIILHEVFKINIGFFVVALNAVFIYVGYKKIGKTFAIQTMFTVVLFSLGLIFVHIKPITNDKLLIAIFGGILIGTGSGLVIRGGGLLDGFEVITVFTQRKTGLSNSEITTLFNLIIFGFAILYFGIETSMYSIITYFTATRATDYVVDGIEEYTAVNIISSKPEEIKSFLVNDLGKGITVYKGEKGYLPNSYDIKTDAEIIVTIVTRLEIKQIHEAVINIDANAFVYVHIIKEATGGILKEKSHPK